MPRVALPRCVLRVAEFVGIAVILAVFIYIQVPYAAGLNGYVSDEVWYVSSSRNILREIFGLQPRYPGSSVRVTVELDKPSSVHQYDDWVDHLVNFIESAGGEVIKGTEFYRYSAEGKFLPAVCAEVPPEAVEELTTFYFVKRVVRGYCYPNAEGIIDYMNYEHPPLGKLLIATSIAVCGDSPICWRLPSILAGATILLLAYLIVRESVGGSAGGFLGCVTAAIIATDKLFRSLSMVAMLDIFVSLFSILSLYLVMKGKLFSSAVSLGLAASSKFSGAFTAVAYVLRALKKEIPAKVILYAIYVPLAVFLILSIPIIAELGIYGWWGRSVEGAIRWHLSVKTSNGPPSSAPWDWLLGVNPFPLHYVQVPETGEWVADLIALGNIHLYVLAVILSMFVLPKFSELPDRGNSYVYTWVTFLGYVAIWFLGAKTQYSFYMVHITPMLYVTLMLIVFYVTSDIRNINKLVKAWVDLLKTLKGILAGEVRIKLVVERSSEK